MKTKLMHIIYIAIIAGVILLQSSMNVIEDELRIEMACKDFIIDILKEKTPWIIWQKKSRMLEL